MERIVPETIQTLTHGVRPVVRVVAHPPSAHRPGCPIKAELTAVQVIPDIGPSRWYGCDKAWIGSDLRMHVFGFDGRFSELRNWPSTT